MRSLQLLLLDSYRTSCCGHEAACLYLQRQSEVCWLCCDLATLLGVRDVQESEKSPSLQLAERGIVERAGQASPSDPQVEGVYQRCSGSHSGCGLEFHEKKLGSLKIESLRPGSGRVKVSGADFVLGRSLGTDRKSGASVERGVVGALLGPLRVLDGRGVSEIEMAGGKVPIFRFVAS